MATNLLPNGMSSAIRKVAVLGEASMGAALTRLALAIEGEAKTNAGGGAHPYGTPTGASPGSGPWIISGTVRRAITHTRAVPHGFGGWACKVGMAAGVPHPNSNAMASQIGAWLENGTDRMPPYPFLYPAWKSKVHGWGWRSDFTLWH